MIPFNIPPFVGDELTYIKEAAEKRKISGDGEFTKKSSKLLEESLGANKILLTTSGTSALDMAALLSLKRGDEVILPSYTFSSTATSCVLAGARLVFVDIRPDTMNIDENKIEAAITDKTRAVMLVHYAGVACDMEKIFEIAKKYNLFIIEDAAQALYAKYKDKFLGTLGDFGCYSFHETKNLSSGEGGAIAVKDAKNNERAEILREKGTNRSKFFRGEIDKYTWVDFGDSYLLSELNAAYLYGELINAEKINKSRMDSWNFYNDNLKDLAAKEKLELMTIPDYATHNAHMFYVKLKDLDERTKFINYLKERDIGAVFHYIPLHSAPAGKIYGRLSGKDEYTTKESERLVRLPLYYDMDRRDLEKVVETIYGFCKRI